MDRSTARKDICGRILMKMEVKQIAAYPKGFAVTEIEIRDGVLAITALSAQVSPHCPLCGTPSTRIPSSYQRQVADLPCSGQRVRVLLHVRKCFCQVSTCKRKIFAERITSFAAPWARVTQRLCANRAGDRSSNRRKARRSCDRSARNRDLAAYHSPTDHGVAH
jgi:transposase